MRAMEKRNGYKLLIVDDEEVEREGMAKFIPWSDYGIVLVDTAWNGVEGLEKVRKYHPDIVMTDIKMPVMNGIELIRNIKHEFPDIEFIVLSGYGEYEYTSQAMEEGVRYYILKPCDEEKIIKVIDKVQRSIEERCQHKEQMEQYNTTIRNVLPRAKEQILYNLLMGREQVQADYQLFMQELEPDIVIFLLVIRLKKEIDYIIQFVLCNILEELIGEEMILLSTAFSKDMVFLLHDIDTTKIDFAVKRMETELERLSGEIFQAALSRAGTLKDIHVLYLQTMDLFCMGGTEYHKILLTYDLIRESKAELDDLVSYANLYNAKDMESILLELYLVSCKMGIKGYTKEKRRKVYQWIREVFYKEPLENSSVNKMDFWNSEWELLQDTAKLIVRRNVDEGERSQEEKRMDQILFAVFEHLPEQELTIRYLAKEILFMNEDYFGRLFQRNKKIKFSAYLLKIRIELARKIIQYSPDSKVSDVAKMVGFPEDGQYFSKVFRKETGMTPSQYRELGSEK